MIKILAIGFCVIGLCAYAADEYYSSVNQMRSELSGGVIIKAVK
jgi:hypothetical protein